MARVVTANCRRISATICAGVNSSVTTNRSAAARYSAARLAFNASSPWGPNWSTNGRPVSCPTRCRIVRSLAVRQMTGTGLAFKMAALAAIVGVPPPVDRMPGWSKAPRKVRYSSWRK